MPLTATQLDRYQRQILLKEIGTQGQQALLEARVLIVGAGGLGCPIIAYLAAGGVGHIGICDGDKVELSNLQRQILFSQADIGRAKAIVAAEYVARLNQDVQVHTHVTSLDTDNADALIAPYDLIIEGVDNFESRFVLNAACIRAKKPLLFTALGRFDGHVALFTPHLGPHMPCYRCFVPEIPSDARDCEHQGVAGAMAGLVGAQAALLALLTLSIPAVSLDNTLQDTGTIFILDGLTGTTRQLSLRADPACPDCQSALP